MKATRVFLFLLPVLLTSCGGGGGDNEAPEVVAPIEEAPPVVAAPVAPEPVVTAPVVTPQPAPNDEASPSINPGALSQLYGNVLFSYGFTGEPATFIAETSFAESNLITVESGAPVLASVAQTSFRMSDADPISETGPLNLRCIEVGQFSEFVCVLDAGGPRESLFLLDEIADVLGTIGTFGFFEFCQGDQDCPSELTNSPDGDLVVTITQPSASVAVSAVQGDSLPYLQYFEQGSNSASIETRKRAKNDEIENAVAEIRSSAE